MILLSHLFLFVSNTIIPFIGLSLERVHRPLSTVTYRIEFIQERYLYYKINHQNNKAVSVFLVPSIKIDKID